MLTGMTGFQNESSLESLYSMGYQLEDLLSVSCVPKSILSFWWHLRSLYNQTIQEMYQSFKTLRK